MPLYEYKCSKCGTTFEVIQKIDDPPIVKCLKCGGPTKKIISPPALQFKGSGWYVTDYAHKDNKKSPPDSKQEKKQVTDKSPSDSDKKADKQVSSPK
ncbi:MAG: zinc ribbon domain-containing protein [Candidatus Aminicenantes bacterium]|nr:zinc ribbon domain-containing protein [Candidatus Aminicenantes bacterium]